MMRKNAILVIDALFGLQDPVAQEVLVANGYAVYSSDADTYFQRL